MIQPRRRLRYLTAVIATVVAVSILAPIQPAAAADGAGPDVTVEQVINDGETWSYLDTGADPGATWIDASFDDAGWASNVGQFGYGDGDEATIINFGPDPDNKFATTYFRKTVTLADTHQLEAATAQLTYDDGAAIYINGTRVLATPNLPAGFGNGTWANANAEETIPVTIDPTLFVDGANIIAVEIHQAWRKSNDISFDLALTVDRNNDPKPPTVADDTATTDEGVAIGGNVAANDDAGLTYSTAAVLDPAVGTFTLNTDGTWTLNPAADYFGTFTIAHTACDAAAVCSNASLAIEVISSIWQDQTINDGDTWSYLDTGIYPGADWNTSSFDDGVDGANWATGAGQFGYGDGDETTVLSYGPDADNRYATNYFRKSFTVADIHQVIAAEAALTYDDGAAIYVNGTLAHVTSNLPAGFGNGTWATANREETINVTIDPALFIEGENLIAVEIHQAWRKSNDTSFDLALTLSRDDLAKPPTVADDEAETDEAVAISGDVSLNDEAGLTYSTTAVIDPAVGTFTFNADGTWSLTPAEGYLGTVTVAHSACDGAGVCSDAELNIVVDVVGDLFFETPVTDGDTWSYLDDGTYPGADWNTPSFDDGIAGANWATGSGQFGYGDGDETTVVSFGPDVDNRYTTTYFRKTITLTDAYQFTEMLASLTYDDAAVVYLNGAAIHNTGNLPQNFDSNSWATSGREETVSFTIDPKLFVDGDNTLAVEVHQVWRKSVDLSFDLSLDATRHVLPGPPAPTVLDDRVATPPNVAVSGNVATNDRANDANVPTWTVATVDLPDTLTEGELILNIDGSFAFTPATDFNGTLTVPYSACNDTVCSAGTLTIVVIDSAAAANPGLLSNIDLGTQTLPIALPISIEGNSAIDVTGAAAALLAELTQAPSVELTITGLPTDLAIDESGLLTGTPTVAGTFPVTAYLIDQAGQPAAHSYIVVTMDVVIDDSALVTSALGLPDAIHINPIADTNLTVGEAADIAIEFQTTDGTVLYKWLPAGLTGTIDGHIVGTPTEAGVWTSEITIIDLAGNTAEATVKFTVYAGAPGGVATEHPVVDIDGLEIRPARNQHGVLGFNAADSSVADVRVWDMQQIGDFMYVGGEFQQVQEGEFGAIINQSFLARFNVDTGAYDPTFTPLLDGNVHALEVSPRGVLLVGGEFTNINGIANTSGLAAIDPVTGLVDTSFTASVERPWSTNPAIVREIEVVGDLLYIGGNFSHLRDSASGKRYRFYKLARVGADFGELDLTWKPEVTGGAVFGVGIDQDRGRLMFTGSFSSVAAQPDTQRVAIVDTVIGSVIPHTMPKTAWTVFDIEYANDLIFLANGWNNQITVHNADDFALLYQYESDGDFQFLEKVGDVIFAGCHCTQDPLHPTARALDAVTGLELDIAFNLGGHIDGAWAVATDDRGCAWIGGDIWDGGFDIGTVWARGFARFCPAG
ncbi:MAG: Ig-like domain-containing protein [Acidimicrobiales bacterium]